MLVAEGLLRVFIKQDLLPKKLSIWESELERIKNMSDTSQHSNSYYMYDSILGWTVRPNAKVEPTYYSNNLGIRSPNKTLLQRDTSVLRIAVFGDSFTEGFELNGYEETWSFHLEKNLLDKGIKAEVLNYGVGSYGMDQAYLRWKYEGYKTNPDIVIFGLNMANFWRNLNVFRPNISPGAGIMLTKPRGVVQGDSIIWKNMPTVHPKYILDSVVINFGKSELSKYEHFNEKKLYRGNILDHTYFYNLFSSRHNFHWYNVWSSSNYWDIDSCQEGTELTMNLLNSFKEESNAHGSDFILLQTLQFWEIDMIKNNEEYDSQELLASIRDVHKFCPTDSIVLDYPTSELIETAFNHPTALYNRLIGERLCKYLIDNNIHHLDNLIENP